MSKSVSAFANYPKQVSFCSNVTAAGWTIYPTSCQSHHNICAYRGQDFQIELMVVDDFCFASAGVVEAQVSDTIPEFGGKATLNEMNAYKYAHRFCKTYNYSLSAPPNITASILNFYINEKRSLGQAPASLHVNFIECS